VYYDAGPRVLTRGVLEIGLDLRSLGPLLPSQGMPAEEPSGCDDLHRAWNELRPLRKCVTAEPGSVPSVELLEVDLDGKRITVRGSNLDVAPLGAAIEWARYEAV